MKTEIICILDKSGSMAALRHDVIGGFNTFLADQQKVAGEGRITFVTFNGDVTALCQAAPLESAGPLTNDDYVPGGSTALRDAIGMTLTAQGDRIKKEGWAELVICNIITDGEENCSTDFSADDIKKLIEEKQALGWKILFQAANQDAFVTGGGMGISGATTSNFVATGAGMRDAYGATSMSVTSMRSAPPQPFGLAPDALDAGVPLPTL